MYHMLLVLYQTIRYHIPEECMYLHAHCRKNLGFHHECIITAYDEKTSFTPIQTYMVLQYWQIIAVGI